MNLKLGCLARRLETDPNRRCSQADQRDDGIGGGASAD